MLYKGYRYLRGKQNIAKISDWLKLSLSIFSDLKNRKGKQDARKNKLVAMLYILFGKLTLVAYQDDNQQIFGSKQYFKQALALDPQQDVARAHLAFIQLHDPSSTDKQRITAFGTLQSLAKLMLPEACYMLGKMYEPGGPTLPKAIQIKKDARKARDYLSCAENYQPSPDTKPYHSDIFCTIL